MAHEIEESESVSMSVVDAVSSELDRDPVTLKPIAEVLDPDALNALFAPRENGEQRPGGEISFVYSGCQVTVQNGEYITVRQVKPASSPDQSDTSPSR